MPTFRFDETKDSESNLDAFFAHLVEYDPQFADLLKSQLPASVGEAFDRSKFSKSVVELLDAATTSREPIR